MEKLKGAFLDAITMAAMGRVRPFPNRRSARVPSDGPTFKRLKPDWSPVEKKEKQRLAEGENHKSENE